MIPLSEGEVMYMLLASALQAFRDLHCLEKTLVSTQLKATLICFRMFLPEVAPEPIPE